MERIRKCNQAIDVHGQKLAQNLTPICKLSRFNLLLCCTAAASMIRPTLHFGEHVALPGTLIDSGKQAPGTGSSSFVSTQMIQPYVRLLVCPILPFLPGHKIRA